jgi:hypothetical protein
LDISIRIGDDARDNGLYEGFGSEERRGLMTNIEQQLQEFEDQENALITTLHCDPSISVSSTEDDSMVQTSQEPHTIYSWYQKSSDEEDNIISNLVQRPDIDNNHPGSIDNISIIPPQKHTIL